jgi:mono/diheme cytochrome c family protein
MLDQGWSKELRELFYFTPQGSRLIPYAWFMALERPGSEALFADPANLQRYGFLPADGPHLLNPDGLPIGFAIDPGPARKDASTTALSSAGTSASRGRRELGLTCAACHTANVTVEGRAIRVDGAPSHLDFDSFLADLNRAVTQTLFDPAKFQRFAQRVLERFGAAGLPELTRDFTAYQARLAGESAIRQPALPSGFGRVDALTQILNSLSVRDQGDPTNLRPVDAPTSYPALWLTPHMEFVQWNPIASSPIARNGGEVLGVFGAATLTGETTTLTGGAPGWFSSTLLVQNLHELERWVADLKPPRWDEKEFGAIRTAEATTGRRLFGQYCAGCHNTPDARVNERGELDFRRTDPAENFFGKQFIAIGRVNYRALGVDPTYVESVALRLVRTNAATASLQDGKPIVPAVSYFGRTVGEVVGRAMRDAGWSEAQQIEASGFRLRPSKTPGGQPEPYQPPSVLDLKANPLAGVWATGPYLHNGSIPTIYELLSPVGERRKVFWTGGRELDLKRLGFVSDEAEGLFRFDTGVPGNRNTGHEFPRQGLSHDERMAIVEYLKTL